jgi:hypothetical protein
LRWIDGSATPTTLLSRIAMLAPRIVAISANRFLDPARPAVAEDDQLPPAI